MLVRNADSTLFGLVTLAENVEKCMQLKHTETGAHRLPVLRHQGSVDMSRFWCLQPPH